ncbi:MAG: hypothetical protein ACOC55_04730, partial [Candidatus Natronoplasma sp.]
MEPVKDLTTKAMETIKAWDSRKKLLTLLIVWALIFLPSIAVYTSIHRKTQFAYYPESSSPIESKNVDWNVTVYPEGNMSREN